MIADQTPLHVTSNTGLCRQGIVGIAPCVEHECCGDLDGRVDGDRVWMSCTCGAVINRDADRD